MTNFALPAYDWAPRRDQMELWNKVLEPDFRKGVVVAHRRWGKDELGLQATAIKAMQRVGSYCIACPNTSRRVKPYGKWSTGAPNVPVLMTRSPLRL